MSRFTCDFCNKNFNRNFNLKRDCKNVHNEILSCKPNQLSPTLKCGIYSFTFSRFDKFNNHLINQHYIALNNENVTFDDFAEFEQ